MPDIEGNGYQGPREFVPTNVVNIKELQQIENFEGQNAWAIGLDRQRDFTVSTLTEPFRIVIDIALDPGGAPTAPTTTPAPGTDAPRDALTLPPSECYVLMECHVRVSRQLTLRCSKHSVRSVDGDEVEAARAHAEDAAEEVHERPDRQGEHGGADADEPPSAQPVTSTAISMAVRTTS